jgi:hypothetical protein
MAIRGVGQLVLGVVEDPNVEAPLVFTSRSLFNRGGVKVLPRETLKTLATGELKGSEVAVEIDFGKVGKEDFLFQVIPYFGPHIDFIPDTPVVVRQHTQKIIGDLPLWYHLASDMRYWERSVSLPVELAALRCLLDRIAHRSAPGMEHLEEAYLLLSAVAQGEHNRTYEYVLKHSEVAWKLVDAQDPEVKPRLCCENQPKRLKPWTELVDSLFEFWSQPKNYQYHWLVNPNEEEPTELPPHVMGAYEWLQPYCPEPLLSWYKLGQQKATYMSSLDSKLLNWQHPKRNRLNPAFR